MANLVVTNLTDGTYWIADTKLLAYAEFSFTKQEISDSMVTRTLVSEGIAAGSLRARYLGVTFTADQVTNFDASTEQVPGSYLFTDLPLDPGDGDSVVCLDRSIIVTPTKAELDMSSMGAGAVTTLLESVTAWDLGNLGNVELVGDSVPAAGITIDVSYDGWTWTIHFEDGVSTVAQMETAIGLVPAAKLQVKTPGGVHTLVVPGDEETATYLTGGIGLRGAVVHWDALCSTWRYATGGRVT